MGATTLAEHRVKVGRRLLIVLLVLATAACEPVVSGGGQPGNPSGPGVTTSTTAPPPTTTPTTTTPPPTTPPPAGAFPVRPGVVYTKADIDSWSTSSPEYARLKGSWAGNVNRAHTVYGAEISSTERDLLKDESGYLKVQAVLWAADNDAARRAKVVAMLNELRAVTSWQVDAGQQYRLVAGWSCTNIAQAASIIGYQDAQLTRFLVQECYPILDWPQNPNWHASFADSKLAIAAYAGDPALWADAKRYFNTRIAQSIYVSAYDSGKVKPLRDDGGAVMATATLQHWGQNSKSAGAQVKQVGSDFVFVEPALAVDGANAEQRRDLGHVSMSLGAWMHGARTILAQGEALEPQARARLAAGYSYHASRVLGHLVTGIVPAPSVLGAPSGDRLQGWYGARELFGSSTPASVVKLLSRAEVTGYPPAGANHLVAEQFADA
jgi:hypothetical protein